MSQLVQWVATFLVALVVGLVRQWELALLLFVIIPFMALAGALFSRVSYSFVFVVWC